MPHKYTILAEMIKRQTKRRRLCVAYFGFTIFYTLPFISIYFMHYDYSNSFVLDIPIDRMKRNETKQINWSDAVLLWLRSTKVCIVVVVVVVTIICYWINWRKKKCYATKQQYFFKNEKKNQPMVRRLRQRIRTNATVIKWLSAC